ncbi:hypothetical protein ACKX2L_08555 [Lachnospiraceae bacterium YH-ros2228]
MKQKVISLICMGILFTMQIFNGMTVHAKTEIDKGNTVYYVDADHGNDSNSGLSEVTPWRTLAKVNSTEFQPGNKILFKCGDTWKGMLKPGGSGSLGENIVISSYGSGKKPVIDGAGAEAAVKLDGQEYWTISNICAENNASERAVRQGIYVNGKGSGITHNITIKDCEVCNVIGENRRSMPTYQSMYWNSGIYISMPGRSSNSTHYDGVLIKNNYVHDVTTSGIRINQREDFIIDPYHTNVLIEGNTIERTGSDGMIVANCVSPLIQYNKCYDAGALGNRNDTKIIAGMWTCGTKNALFQYNEVARTRLFDSDGTAFDTDWGTSGTTIFQYNYTHGNGGGFWLDCGGINRDPNYVKTILRFNISADDENYLVRAGDMETEIYNNTFYKSSGTLNACFGNNGTKHRFWNNIFYFPQTPNWAKSDYDNNIYYPCSASDTDENAITSDPGLLNPVAPQDGISYAANYGVNSSSIACNKGIYIGQNGGKDFSGNTLKSKHMDIGAIQASLTTSGDQNDFCFERSFNGEQGTDNWFYYSGDVDSKQLMKWNGQDERWHGLNTYNLLWAPGHIHPDVKPTIIGWQAAKNGKVQLTGNPRKIDSGNDGIRVKIYKNQEQIWPASGWTNISGDDLKGVSYDLVTEVSKGDFLYFVVDKNQNTYNDGSKWDPHISYNVTESYTFANGFSNTQQKNNWSYLIKNDAGYSPMTWNSSDNRWHGNHTYSLIWAPAQMHPDTDDTVIAWTAPHDGKIRLMGQPRKANSGYDGVRVKILKNADQIWPASGWQTIDGNDTNGVAYDLNCSVKKGDVVYFELNQNGNNFADETYWNPTLIYQ